VFHSAASQRYTDYMRKPVPTFRGSVAALSRHLHEKKIITTTTAAFASSMYHRWN